MSKIYSKYTPAYIHKKTDCLSITVCILIFYKRGMTPRIRKIPAIPTLNQNSVFCLNILRSTARNIKIVVKIENNTEGLSQYFPL
jgi:hypothetical protein